MLWLRQFFYHIAKELYCIQAQIDPSLALSEVDSPRAALGRVREPEVKAALRFGEALLSLDLLSPSDWADLLAAETGAPRADGKRLSAATW